MPSGWYSCNSYAISKDNTRQGFVLFVQFVFSKIKRQILLDSNIKNTAYGLMPYAVFLFLPKELA